MSELKRDVAPSKIESADNRLSSACLMAAGISGALAVLVGAIGAHGLPGFLAEAGLDGDLIEKRLGQFDVGARYHLAHALLLCGLAALPPGSTPKLIRWSAILTVVGTVLFSGSLYLLVIINTPWLGAITPLGGSSWIVAWGLLAVAGFRRRR